MRQAVGELESQLRHVTNLLAEFKHRAYMAEVGLPPHRCKYLVDNNASTL